VHSREGDAGLGMAATAAARAQEFTAHKAATVRAHAVAAGDFIRSHTHIGEAHPDVESAAEVNQPSREDPGVSVTASTGPNGLAQQRHEQPSPVVDAAFSEEKPGSRVHSREGDAGLGMAATAAARAQEFTAHKAATVRAHAVAAGDFIRSHTHIGEAHPDVESAADAIDPALSFSMNLDFDKLNASHDKRRMVESAIRSEVVRSIANVADDDVAVNFRRGSVIVDCAIKPPPQINRETVMSDLSDACSNDLVERITFSVKAIEGIDSVTEGGELAVTDL